MAGVEVEVEVEVEVSEPDPTRASSVDQVESRSSRRTVTVSPHATTIDSSRRCTIRSAVSSGVRWVVSSHNPTRGARVRMSCGRVRDSIAP
jgi:hypothetical protein